MKIIIAGSRNFKDFDLLEDKCDFYIGTGKAVCIVSGTARGADQLGERYADKSGYIIERHPANWSKHGKRAGYIRNEEMAKTADCLIAFWDGKSRGTKHMIDIARREGLRIRVVRVK